MPRSKSKIPLKHAANNRILYEAFHDGELDRTVVIMYIYLPEKYKLVESAFETNPQPNRNNQTIKDAVKAAVDDYNTSTSNKNDLKADLANAIPGPSHPPNLKTKIKLLIYPDEEALGGTAYRQYIFSGENHDVTVRLDPAHGLDLNIHHQLNDYKGISLP